MDESPEITDRLELEALIARLVELRAALVAAAERGACAVAGVHDNYRDSAVNLLHYLALRRRDLRGLQIRLAALGLSSLGRSEAHVMATLDAVLRALRRLAGHDGADGVAAPLGFTRGPELLNAHAEALLGPVDPSRGVRIMVTMPSEAADDPQLVRDLLVQGMACMRINCAHDAPARWQRMIDHLRGAERDLGRACRVAMDLGGPKLRTGPLEPGPSVLRVRPRRDAVGRAVAPGQAWLVSDDGRAPPPASDAVCVPVTAAWLARARPGGTIHFTDARGARRLFVVTRIGEGAVGVETWRTAYLVPGLALRHGHELAADEALAGRIGSLPARETRLHLEAGDLLRLRRDGAAGQPARVDADGQVLAPACIGCSIASVFDDVRAGEAIWFDDGQIGGVIEAIDAAGIDVRITHTRAGGAKLGADKGINLPDSALRLDALSPKDIEDLAFVARQADIVELSFANTVADVVELQRRLVELGPRRPGIVLKIETRRGFDHLPELLLAAMRWPCCGVMIARGDLAVECGFERLAEVQEEALWICEAAHVPVIWATQVLETLAKDGLPSRAEITDAAMGHRAECVMLNKGPYVVSAVRVLDDILRRMQAHQLKKQSMLRELHLAHASAELDGAPAGQLGTL